ncbi:FAD:protein FMN transferase [Candidatus Nomurabacteria bacterium]|nr:FAD:protein FMN transferase [Candidatus Nomurabacteria bacterium]
MAEQTNLTTRYQLTHRGLGTIWRLEIFEQVTDWQSLKEQITYTIDQFDDDYSRFKPDSILSKLNQNRRTEPNLELEEMLKIALQYYQVTFRIFDISQVHRLIDQGYGLTKTPTKDLDSRLDQIVRLDRSGVTLAGDRHLDFGGFGKGYLIDKLARILEEEYHINQYLINGGGDILVGDLGGDLIKLALEDPWKQNSFLGEVALSRQALACSSPAKRKWKLKTGEVYNHLLGNNGEIKLASMVIAKTALESDIFATTFTMISGKEQLELSKKFDLDYLVIDQDYQTRYPRNSLFDEL